MTIRNAISSDFKFISEISDSIYKSMKNTALFNWPSNVIIQELEYAITLVIEENGEIVSFVCYRDLPDFYEVSALATRILYQKNNYQSLLIHYLQELAAKQRKSVILEVHQENTPAKHLYQKMGFILVNSRLHYYSDKANALVMKWDSHKAGC